jgi:hypothetical protein
VGRLVLRHIAEGYAGSRPASTGSEGSLDRLRTFLISGALTALATTAIAGPAIGADTEGTLAIVNGIPGKRIDVCVNGKEIKSNLPYGGKVLKDVVGTGPTNLKFYEHDPRRCRGHQVGREILNLAPADDLTIVATKNDPKVVIFVNLGYGEIPPAGTMYPVARIIWRHAAETPVTFRFRSWVPDPETPVNLAADPVSTKGQEAATTAAQSIIIQFRVTLPDDPDTIAVKRAEMEASHRYEWILVGSKPGNAKFVFLDREISNPSP